MTSRTRRDGRPFRPASDRLESRVVLSGGSVPAEVSAILKAAGGRSPVRPWTPVLPFGAPAASATFIDPSVDVVQGKRISVGRKDLIAPYATLDATKGVITIGSSSVIEDAARLVAHPGARAGLTGIAIGDFVVVGDGAIIRGPAAIGAKGGAPTSIGADALIDGAIIEPGAFVGALARVGPGVTVPTGFRVLPGADVTTNQEASDPALGDVVRVTSTDLAPTNAYQEIQISIALASGYTTLFEGDSATGGAAITGPTPSAISAPGSTTDFGNLNAVSGASSEPGSKNVGFEPTSGMPLFLQADGTLAALAPNRSYRLKARLIGNIRVGQSSASFAAALGRGDSIRADEGQPITIGSIASLGDHVSIRSPLGGVQGSTTTTVVTRVTDTVTGVTTTTSTASTVTSAGFPTATPGVTIATSVGVNTVGHPTTGITSKTITTETTTLGAVTIGRSFAAGSNAVIQGNPTETTTIGDHVTIGIGSVVSGSSIGTGSVIGNRAYVANSTIGSGVIVPDGAILIDNAFVGFVQP